MVVNASYTRVRAQLAEYLDRAGEDLETVIVNRRGKEDVALVSAAELRSLMETAHLMRSPKNAQRLLAALQRSQANEGVPTSVEQLKREVGFGDE